MKLHKASQIEKACSKAKDRFMLQNPYIDTSDATKPVIVATCGLIMAIVPVEASLGESGFLPVSVLKQARKLRDNFTETDIAVQTATAEGSKRTYALRNGAVLPDELGDVGRYPNWRQVLPAKDRTNIVRVSLNPTLLLQLAEAIGAGDGITLEIAGDAKPIVVRGSSWKEEGRSGAQAPLIPEAFGVIMPIATLPKEEAKAAAPSVPAYVA